jgi:hypothetical protein
MKSGCRAAGSGGSKEGTMHEIAALCDFTFDLVPHYRLAYSLFYILLSTSAAGVGQHVICQRSAGGQNGWKTRSLQRIFF